jgi:hypothetical protein
VNTGADEWPAALVRDGNVSCMARIFNVTHPVGNCTSGLMCVACADAGGQVKTWVQLPQ